MTRARKDIINLKATPYYHVVSRCVRRTYLCGFDKETGQDYSHRKQWIVSRMKFLANIFAINIAAYAVMSNHYHMVLHVDDSIIDTWTNQEILEKCRKLFPRKVKEYEKRETLDPQDPILQTTLIEWRGRLADLSWFMRFMNEPIARQANLEDDCKGHFWESRFKSQALLDEGAVLCAMVYVDLNPIRSGMANSPELSDYTSIKERIDSLQCYLKDKKKSSPQPKDLMQLEDNPKDNTSLVIPFNLKSYVKLVDETGRVMRKNKRGRISNSLAPILTRLGISSEIWTDVVQTLETHYAHIMGSDDQLREFDGYLRPPKGTNFSTKLYSI